MLLCEMPPDDRSYSMQYIFTRQIEGRRNLRTPGRFIIPLFFHYLRTDITKLYPGIGMDLVINAVMTRLIAACHFAVCGIYDRIAFKCRNIALPKTDSFFYWLKLSDIGNAFVFCFFFQIFILNINEVLADRCRHAHIHQRTQQCLLLINVFRQTNLLIFFLLFKKRVYQKFSSL